MSRTTPTGSGVPPPREAMTWRILCAIVRAEVRRDPDPETLRERIRASIRSMAFRMPTPAEIDHAMNVIAPRTSSPPPLRPTTHRNPLLRDPTIVPRGRGGSVSRWTPIGRAHQATIGNDCGASKTILDAPPLKCSREAGHRGDHGVHAAGVLVVRWARESSE